jgi:hypothetical protein
MPSWPQVAIVVTILAIGAVAGFAIASREPDVDFAFDPPEQPAEYLYLDVARVLTYLPQAEGGLPENETESIEGTNSVSVDLKGTAGGVGGSAQRRRSASRSLTPTTGSRFLALLDHLDEDGQLKQLDLTHFDSDDFEALEEGDFVRLHNADIRMPSYAADYDVNKTRKHVIVASGQKAYTRTQRRKINAFLAAAGENPRVSFLLTATADDQLYSLLLPAQYSLLSAEPTLLTGRHTVIGKVMRRLEPADPENAAFSDSKYTDVATIASFRPALRALPKFWVTLRARAARESLEETRRRLDVDEDDPGYRASVREFRRSPLRARARLQKQLAALTTITAPGLVILPIAIYK